MARQAWREDCAGQWVGCSCNVVTRHGHIEAALPVKAQRNALTDELQAYQLETGRVRWIGACGATYLEDQKRGRGREHAPSATKEAGKAPF